MELSGTTIYYPVGGNLGQDINNWIKKDVATGNTTYYGYSLVLGADSATAVWRIRREVVTGTVTVVTYANSGLFNVIWNNRSSAAYK